MLKAVPQPAPSVQPEPPPKYVVPYNVRLTRIKPRAGPASSFPPFEPVEDAPFTSGAHCKAFRQKRRSQLGYGV
jgi:hypothetical protein